MKLFLALLLCCIHVLALSQSKSSITYKCIRFSEQPISLKNNYVLIRDTIGGKRVVTLKGPGIDTIVRSTHIKASEFNLGYLQFDADSFFILSTDDGGLDTSIQVFNKHTGKILLFGHLFSFNRSQYTISYYDYGRGNKFGVFNLMTGKIETYPPPEVHCGFWHECVDKVNVTDTEVQLIYYGINNQMTNLVYKR